MTFRSSRKQHVARSDVAQESPSFLAIQRRRCVPHRFPTILFSFATSLFTALDTVHLQESERLVIGGFFMNAAQHNIDGASPQAEKRLVSIHSRYSKCGKPNCKTCRNGRGHGPYAYAYWRENGKLHKLYLGRVRPTTTPFRIHTQYSRCGKPNCTCTTGKGHGPYQFVYWRENGKRRKKYLGKAQQ